MTMNNYQKALNNIGKSSCPNCCTEGCKECSIEKICNTKQWVNTLQKLVDKATSKKVIKHHMNFYCPTCNRKLTSRVTYYFCPKKDCGQALDWSDVNE